MKDLLQTSPTYRRFCRVCVNVASVYDSKKDLLHTSQWYGRSPLCMGWWSLRRICQLNDSLHTTHTYQYCMSCMCLCWFTVLAVYKQYIMHSEIEWMLSPVNTFMLLQFNLLNERLVTCAAVIQTHPTVCALMFDKHTSSIKWSITDTAHVWMFIIMYGSTTFRKTLAGTRFLTNNQTIMNEFLFLCCYVSVCTCK